MKTRLMILALMVVALFATGFVAPAKACDNCYGGGGGDWGGWGLGYLYGSLDYNVPYFAAHPPVYYSYPVPRTYGYSPFAYPPGVMTPDIEMGEEAHPVEIVNPYVPREQQDQARADQSASNAKISTQPEPLVIINPFVAGAKSIAKVSE